MVIGADVKGRFWDSFDGYLFDIDGTLLRCNDAVHYFAFCDALKTLTGRDLTLEGVTAEGNTDVGILRDALLLAEIREAEWRPRIPEIRVAMGRFVAEHGNELRITVLPHVVAVLEHLRGRGAKLGIATGNLREIGRLKLERAGLLDFFEVEGWSDAYEYRKDVFCGAAGLMRELIGEQGALCVVGDTPTDIEASRVNALPIIAVATGTYSKAQLLATHPDLCLSSFAVLFGQN